MIPFSLVALLCLRLVVMPAADQSGIFVNTLLGSAGLTGINPGEHKPLTSRDHILAVSDLFVSEIIAQVIILIIAQMIINTSFSSTVNTSVTALERSLTTKTMQT